MENDGSAIPWTEEQWNLVQQTVRDEARKVRVAASFLPLYGPLPPDAQSVPLQEVDQEDTGETRVLTELADFIEEQGKDGVTNLPVFLRRLDDEVRKVEHSSRRLRGEAAQRLFVNDSQTRPLTSIAVNVYLSRPQLMQPDLASALIMFRRAANLIARVEDRIVFGGQPADASPEVLNVHPPIFRVSGGEQFRGLIAEAANAGNCIEVETSSGEKLVRAVADAIARLEGFGHLAPFALVLGSDLFVTAHTPNANSLVLPADRIKPLLNGPLLRSSTIHPTEGVLVSLASELVDLVVASDISVRFLQVTMEPRYVYRVAQRFALRVKQPRSIMALLLSC